MKKSVLVLQPCSDLHASETLTLMFFRFTFDCSFKQVCFQPLNFYFPGSHILWRLLQVLVVCCLNLDRWTWDKQFAVVEESAFLARFHSTETWHGERITTLYVQYAFKSTTWHNESSVNTGNLRWIQVLVVHTIPGWVLAIRLKFKYLKPLWQKIASVI